MNAGMYNRVKTWLDRYSAGGVEDQRSVQNFMDCETAEEVTALRTELYSISQGKYIEKSLDQIIGPNRRMRFGSYSEWAKMMLLWMASHKG